MGESSAQVKPSLSVNATTPIGHKTINSFFKWANPGLFLFIFVLFSLQIQYKLKKHRWCAWDSNPGLQDGRRRRNHGAMAATTNNSLGTIVILSNSSTGGCSAILSIPIGSRYSLDEPVQQIQFNHHVHTDDYHLLEIIIVSYFLTFVKALSGLSNTIHHTQYLCKIYECWLTIKLFPPGWPPQLRGFVCTYHPAAPGSNPKHTIYAFSICIEVVTRKGRNKQIEAGNGPF